MHRPGIADMPVVGRFAARLAIDPGSNQVRIARAGPRSTTTPGLQEFPAIVLIDRSRNKLVAIGQEAAEIASGTLPDHLLALRPIRRGVVAEPDAARIMLTLYLRQMTKGVGRPRVIAGMPASATPAERMVMMGVIIAAGAGSVRIFPSPLAVGLALGLPISGSRPRLIIDAGVGGVEVALIALNQVIFARSLPFGGDWLDTSIVRQLRMERGEVLPLDIAERAKLELAALDDSKDDGEKQHFSSLRLMHRTSYIELSSEEVSKAIRASLHYLVEELRWLWLEFDPRTHDAVIEDGATVVGSMAELPGFCAFLSSELEFKCQTPELKNAQINGLSQVAANPARFKLALEQRQIT